MNDGSLIETATRILPSGHYADQFRGHSSRAIRVSLMMVQSIVILFDLVLAMLVFVGSSETYHFTLGIRPPHIFQLYQLSAVVALVFVLLLGYQDVYSARSLRLRYAKLRKVAGSWVISVSLALWLTFLLKESDGFSRAAFVVILFAGLPVTAIGHYGAVWAVGRMMERHQLSVTSAMLVMVGGEFEVSNVVKGLRWAGISVRDLLVIKPRDIPEPVQGWHDDFSVVQKALTELETQPYDAIFLYCDWSNRQAIQKIASHLSRVPVPLYLVADEVQREILANTVVNLGESDAYELHTAPLTEFQRLQKRCFDIVVSCVALIVLAPVMLLATIAILIESGRPIFFMQFRKGFGRKAFGIFKFRSMHVQENGKNIRQATRNDPRISRVGAFLRRTSIDEMPQFLNVLRGEMSVIGPRPHALSHDDYYGELIGDYAYRHHMKPGISGWAQINGYRGETQRVELMERRVEHDLWYIGHWSLRLDFYILWRTFLQTMFPSKNVY